MTLYQVLHELQIVQAVILGACPLCYQPVTLDSRRRPRRNLADLTSTTSRLPAVRAVAEDEAEPPAGRSSRE